MQILTAEQITIFQVESTNGKKEKIVKFTWKISANITVVKIYLVIILPIKVS